MCQLQYELLIWKGGCAGCSARHCAALSWLDWTWTVRDWKRRRRSSAAGRVGRGWKPGLQQGRGSAHAMIHPRFPMIPSHLIYSSSQPPASSLLLPFPSFPSPPLLSLPFPSPFAAPDSLIILLLPIVDRKRRHGTPYKRLQYLAVPSSWIESAHAMPGGCSFLSTVS